MIINLNAALDMTVFIQMVLFSQMHTTYEMAYFFFLGQKFW